MLERGQTGCSKLSGLLWGSLSSPAYALSSPSHLSHCRGQGGRLPRARPVGEGQGHPLCLQLGSGAADPVKPLLCAVCLLSGWARP